MMLNSEMRSYAGKQLTYNGLNAAFGKFAQ